MKKLLSPVAAVLLILALTACSSSKLAEGFDTDTVKTQTEALINLTNDQNFDGVVAMIREDLQSQVTADSLETGWKPLLDSSGAFEKISSTAVYGQKDQSTGENYAVCVAVCKYANTSRTFTISMDTDYKIVGLYMK